jgi:predicted ATPase
VIASGIDRLDRDQREVLYSAAVIGMEFDEATLVAVGDLDPLEATRLLDDLVAANLIRFLGGGRFAFRHRIIQEVAYETQLRDRRRRSHGLVAAALEGRDDASRQPAVVAVHHERAGNLDAAATWYGRAAEGP